MEGRRRGISFQLIDIYLFLEYVFVYGLSFSDVFKFMSKDSRLNNNSLSGPIPPSLTNITALQVL